MIKHVFWPNILLFVHLVWCCLIMFGKIWNPSNIRSKSIKHHYISRVWCALFGSFGWLHQACLACTCVLLWCRFLVISIQNGCWEHVWWLVWYTFGHVIKLRKSLVTKHVWSWLVTKHFMFDWSLRWENREVFLYVNLSLVITRGYLQLVKGTSHRYNYKFIFWRLMQY